jgi:hypothetical protein
MTGRKKAGAVLLLGAIAIAVYLFQYPAPNILLGGAFLICLCAGLIMLGYDPTRPIWRQRR